MNIYLNIGFCLIKMFLLIFILIVLKYNKIKRINDSNQLLDLLVKKGMQFFCVLIVTQFLCIQIGVYDGFIVSLILFLLLFFDHFKTFNLKNIFIRIQQRWKKTLLKTVEKLENKERIFNLRPFFTRKKELQNKNILFSIFLVIILTIAGSFFYLKYDHYLFSSVWFETLKMVNYKNQQIFFTEFVYPEGLYSFINYLSRITNASTEISIYFYSIIQLIALMIVLYWFVLKTTRSKVIIPLTICIFFLLGFTFLPVNITSFFQSNSIHLSFVILFPIFYFFWRPGAFKERGRKNVLWFIIFFFAIALINIYTFLFVLPIYFAIGFFFLRFSKERRRILFAYIIVFILSFCFYYLAVLIRNEDFYAFFRRNIIEVELFFYNPFLSENIDKLLFRYQLFFFFGFVFNIFIRLFFRINWIIRTIMFLFCFFTYLLTQIKFEWIDKDILFEILLILFPLQIGIVLSIFIDTAKLVLRNKVLITSRYLIVFVIMILFLWMSQSKYLLVDKEKNDLMNEELLVANEMILSNYLDRSYMVSGRSYLGKLSSGKRFFIEYEYFLGKNYLIKDSIYSKYKNDSSYLLKNPQVVIPSSVLVFVFNKNNDQDNYSKEEILNRIDLLKQKGRPVRKIHTTAFFEIYEIINKRNSSKVSEMIIANK